MAALLRAGPGSAARRGAHYGGEHSFPALLREVPRGTLSARTPDPAARPIARVLRHPAGPAAPPEWRTNSSLYGRQRQSSHLPRRRRMLATLGPFPPDELLVFFPPFDGLPAEHAGGQHTPFSPAPAHNKNRNDATDCVYRGPRSRLGLTARPRQTTTARPSRFRESDAVVLLSSTNLHVAVRALLPWLCDPELCNGLLTNATPRPVVHMTHRGWVHPRTTAPRNLRTYFSLLVPRWAHRGPSGIEPSFPPKTGPKVRRAPRSSRPGERCARPPIAARAKPTPGSSELVWPCSPRPGAPLEQPAAHLNQYIFPSLPFGFPRIPCASSARSPA